MIISGAVISGGRIAVSPELLNFNVTPTTSTAGPINNIYRREIYKSIYTSTECNNGGLFSGMNIMQIGLYVLNQPTYQPYPDYTVGIQNTVSAVGSDLTSGWTTIYGPTSTSFTVDTFFTVTLATPFAYTGNNLAVGFAWGQSPTNFSSSGVVRSNNTGSSRAAGTDASGAYILTNTAAITISQRPVIYLTLG